MQLDVQPRGDAEQRTLEGVEYFEIQSDAVYVETMDGGSETIRGELYGGEA